MDSLGSSDSGEVAVALIGEYEFVGLQTLDSSGNSRSTTVCSLDEIHVDVVVGKY